MMRCRNGAESRLGTIAWVLLPLALSVLAVPAGSEDEAQGRPPPALQVRLAQVDAAPSGPSVAERLTEIRRRIQRAVEYPPRARRRGLEGVATVGFEIDRADGRAQGIQVVDSSGHASLDRAAERSVVRAGSLPWVYGRLRVPVRFDLEEDR